jgi:hypothetical protein
MVAFGADVSRQSEGLRRQYAAGLRRYLDGFVRALSAELGEGRADEGVRACALAQFSTMVGAVVLARGVAAADPALSDEILAGALASLERETASETASREARGARAQTRRRQGSSGWAGGQEAGRKRRSA